MGRRRKKTGHTLEEGLSPYQRVTTRFGSGERFAFMVDRETGVPDPWVCRYAIAKLRQFSINLANRAIDIFCLFHEWAAKQGIDVAQRFESGILFSVMEIENLSEFLRTSKKLPVEIERQSIRRVVVGNTHKDRLKRITSFIWWRMSHVLPSIADQERAAEVSSRLSEIKNVFLEHMKGSKQKSREALTDDELHFLMEVIRPDHSLNPFTERTRHRNFAIILMIAELGVREAEPLVLKSEHVNIAGSRPTIRIEPNPNDPEDFRKDQPLVKTNGRLLPLSRILAATIDRYIMHHRTRVPGYKRNPFIFLETHSGRAMSLDAVYDIFRVLRRRFPDRLPPDLSAHKLRHTWNSRFRRLATEYGWKEAFRRVVNNYIMGWSKMSEQDTRYGHSEIMREAERALLQMQIALGQAAS